MKGLGIALLLGTGLQTLGTGLGSGLGFGLAAVAALGLPAAAGAQIGVLDYDSADRVDFLTGPYLEDGTTTRVDSGHYEILADGGGTSGDQAFNVDEEAFGLSQVTLSVDGGHLFDVLSLDVVHPADTPGDYTISGVGGGSVSAPTIAGPLVLGPAFHGITALVIEQNSAGSFAVDDVTIRVLPEPGAIASLLAPGLALLALGRRRAA